MADTQDINIRLSADNSQVLLSLTQVQQQIRMTQTVVNVFNQQVNQTFKQLNESKPPALLTAVTKLAEGLEKFNAPGIAFEEALAGISAQTGITGQELEQLGEKALEMGTTTGLGALKGLEACRVLVSQLGLAKSGVEGLNILQEKTLLLAQASGVEVTEAAQSMGGALEQFGLQASDAGRVMNVLAAGVRLGASGMPEWSQALNAAGEEATRAGIGMETTAAALEVLGRAQLKGTEAGNVLSSILSRMQEVLGADFSVNNLPEVLDSLKTKLNDTAYLNQVFGESNAEAARFLISQAEAVEEVTQKLTEHQVAEEQLAIRNNTVAAQLATMRQLVDEVKIRFFNLTGGATAYISAAGEMIGEIQGAVTLFTDFINVMNMLTDAQRLQTLWAGIVKTATAIWTGIQWVLNSALWACPLTWIVAGIIALVAAIVWVCTKLTGWGSLWKGIIGYIKFSFLEFVEKFKLSWTVVSSVFILRINSMLKKWYQLKNLLGFGDQKENEAAIARLDADSDARKKAMVDGVRQVMEYNRKARESLSSIEMGWKKSGNGKQTESVADGVPGLNGQPGNATIPGNPSVGLSASALPTGQTHMPDGLEQSSQKTLTGGSKSSQVVIHLGKLMDQVNIYAQEFQEGLNDLDNKVLESLTRVLTIAQSSAV